MGARDVGSRTGADATMEQSANKKNTMYVSHVAIQIQVFMVVVTRR